ncbi:hypothetical protein, partial [Tamlana crocina]|uniref:hypothetical protein n=1 Tax=Tamlana crocina TaxID=393006 RepID=UPI001ADDA774
DFSLSLSKTDKLFSGSASCSKDIFTGISMTLFLSFTLSYNIHRNSEKVKRRPLFLFKHQAPLITP